MNKALIILSFLVVSSSFSIAQSDDFKEKRVLREKKYYPNGQLMYYNKTTRRGLKNNNQITGMQIIRLREFYENGQIRLKEKKKIARIIEGPHLSEDRHVLKQKKEWRKYKKWNKEGKKTEKGKYGFNGSKKIIKYNYLNHRRVIITFNFEKNRDVMNKKGMINKPYK